MKDFAKYCEKDRRGPMSSRSKRFSTPKPHNGGQWTEARMRSFVRIEAESDRLKSELRTERDHTIDAGCRITEIEAEVERLKAVCQWQNDCDDTYSTECRNNFFFVDENGPKENNFKFCPFCGKEIKEMK